MRNASREARAIDGVVLEMTRPDQSCSNPGPLLDLRVTPTTSPTRITATEGTAVREIGGKVQLNCKRATLSLNVHYRTANVPPESGDRIFVALPRRLFVEDEAKQHSEVVLQPGAPGSTAISVRVEGQRIAMGHANLSFSVK